VIKHTFIEEMKSGISVDDYYVLAKKSDKTTKNGDPYLRLTLSDSTGRIDAMMWSDSIEKWGNDFEVNTVVRIRGKVGEFDSKPQLTIERIGVADEANYSPTWFLPLSPVSVEEVIDKIKKHCDSITNASLKELANKFFNSEYFDDFFHAPGAANLHHAYIGGLAVHTLGVMDICCDFTNRYSTINKDLLLVAALLHDIGKTVENSWAVTFSRTPEGDLLGHIVQGVRIVDSLLSGIELEEKLRLNLEHCLVSHHGYYEYGSPKLPMTREALALHLADYADSHFEEYDMLLRDIDEGACTGSIRFLEGRKLYNI